MDVGRGGLDNLAFVWFGNRALSVGKLGKPSRVLKFVDCRVVVVSALFVRFLRHTGSRVQHRLIAAVNVE